MSALPMGTRCGRHGDPTHTGRCATCDSTVENPARVRPFDQLLLDLFTTACEGGINYWSRLDSYHWSKAAEDARPSEYTSQQDLHGFYADVAEYEEDMRSLRIDRTVLERGYRLAFAQRDHIVWSTANPPHMGDSDGIEEWGYDAGDADCIVQFGLFGKVMYG